MATVNFSVPDEVKKEFNETFAGQNKSAIIARLMHEAVEEAKRQVRRHEAIHQLTKERKNRPGLSDEEFLRIRQAQASPFRYAIPRRGIGV